jgi:hypothetical protein
MYIQALCKTLILVSLQDMPVDGSGLHNTFSVQQVEDLKKYITETNRITFGRNIIQCRKFVYDYAEVNQMPYRFDHNATLTEWTGQKQS